MSNSRVHLVGVLVGAALFLAACGSSSSSSSVTSTELSATTTATTTTTTPTAPPTAHATVEQPTNGSTVGISENVSGRASGIPAGWQLWLVITPPGSTSYHPQPGPLTVGSGGSFEGAATFGNTSSASIGTYLVRLVLVDSAGGSQFRAYIASATAAGTYPGLPTLPPGAETLDSVQVSRS